MKLTEKFEEILSRSFDDKVPSEIVERISILLIEVVKERDQEVLGVGKYAEPHAIENIDIEIGRSETVARIGKNMDNTL